MNIPISMHHALHNARPYFSLLGLISSSLMLMACQNTEEFERPVMDLPTGSTTISSVGTTWWTIFHDSELNRLEQQALTYNRDLIRASALVDRATALMQGTKADELPQANLKAGVNSQELTKGQQHSQSLPDRGRDLWEMSGVLSYEVDLWGKLRARTEASRAEALSTIAARDAVFLRLTAEVASAYINVRTWEEKCRIISRVHDSYKQTCAMYEKRFQQGQYPELALRRVQAECSKTLAQLKKAENALSMAGSALAVLSGESPRTIVNGKILTAGNSNLLPSPPTIPASIPSNVIEMRPDIYELESRLKSAFYGQKAAWADRFPSFSLTGELGQISTDLSKTLNQPNRLYNAGGNILQTLFDGGKKQATLKASSAEYAATKATYEQTVLNAFCEIRNALVERKKSMEIYDATRDEVENLRRSWDIASKQYDAGYVGLMDALDTHRNLLSGELDMADAAQMRLNAIVKFCKSLGGGWTRHSKQKA
ncbi:MAG: TolC family protein [Akkermansia sp.]